MEPGRRAVEREMDVPIEGASPGDAITEYYLAWRAAILRGMRTRLDETDAEDVVQEIFLTAWQDICRYDETRSSLRTWLARISDQVLARHFREVYRRQRAEAAIERNGQASPLTPEEKEDLRKLLAVLPSLSCRIITARFLLDESIEKITAQTGLSEEAIWKRIARSRRILRREASQPEPRAGGRE